MKRLLFITSLLTLFLIVGTASLSACEIDVSVQGDTKDSYAKDEILILKITVNLTHRNCSQSIDATQFKGDGMELLGAQKWQQTSGNQYTRLVKVKLTGNDQGEAILHARRSCDKEGGHGVFKVKVQ